MLKKVVLISPSEENSGGINVFMNMLSDSLSQSDIFAFRVYTAKKYRFGKVFSTLFGLFSLLKYVFFEEVDLYYISAGSNRSTYRKIIYMSILILSRKEFVFHMHGGLFYEWTKSLGKYNKILISWVLRKAKLIYIINPIHKELLITEYKILGKSIKIVNNFINGGPEEFLNEKVKKAIFIGKVDSSKGVDVLVESYSKLDRKFELELYGPLGDLEKNKNVLSFYKGLLHDDKWDKLSESAIFILPSKFENFPLTLIEASRASCLIIYTGVGCVDQKYERGKDYIFSSCNVENLKSVMQEIFDNYDNYNSVRESAYLKSKAMTGEQFVLNLIKDLTSV